MESFYLDFFKTGNLHHGTRVATCDWYQNAKAIDMYNGTGIVSGRLVSKGFTFEDSVILFNKF